MRAPRKSTSPDAPEAVLLSMQSATFGMPHSEVKRRTVLGVVECYRCGAEVAQGRFDLEGWAAVHAWADGAGCGGLPQG